MVGRRGNGLIAAALALGIAACSAQPAADTGTAPGAPAAIPATHPVSGLRIIPVILTTGKGQHRIRAELAETREAQAKGLMFRTDLGPDEGMIFPSVPQTARSFWMKNTPLPLDIIFIGPDRRVLNIAANTEPYSEASVYSDGTTSAVLELRGGRAAELGLKPGDAVAW